GTTRETKHESEIVFIFFFYRNWEIVFWCKWYIIFRIFCRLVVLVGINSEDREVPRMSWPYTVIRIRTKFSNRGRRCTYQTDIFISFYRESVIFISVEHWSYRNFLVVFNFLRSNIAFCILFYFA